tara:strand:+ start:1069 stop:2220 length:1152 start_codon:yes stop_codon:yes gene_type:complete
MAKEEFEIKLSEKETYQLTSRLTNFYEKLDTIQDYFLERKKEKVIDIDHEKYSQHFFNDFTMEPKDMDISVELVDGKTFTPSTQIITSLPLESQIGRQITLGVKENNSGKWLGFLRLASPVLMIKPRNELFGGTIQATQVNKSMFNGAIIVPTQPFGYNYLGGKLLALICCSHHVLDLWKEKYDEKVEPCFMETTSLYGDLKGVSQYDGLKPFMRYGSMTESDIFLFPSEEVYMEIRNTLRPLYGKEEWGGNLVDPKGSGPKMREFNKMISILKNHLRNYDKTIYDDFHIFTKTKMKAKTKKRYYYCNYGYDNVIEHVMSNGEVALTKRDNFDRYGLESVIEWWRTKAQRRYETLKKDGKLRHDLEIYTTETINSDVKIDMVR